MARPKGYLLPDDIDIVDNCYVIVAVPNDPNYMRAFWGQVQELGYWWAWQRDPLRQGKQAALRWRTAVAETLEIYDEVGCMSPLTINVNCCDCAGAGTLPTNVNVSVFVDVAVWAQFAAMTGTYTDDGINSPDTNVWPTYQDYTDYKCKFANEFASDLLETWEELARIGLAATSMTIAEMTAFVLGSGSTMFAGLIGAGLASAGTLAGAVALFIALANVGGAVAYRFFNDLLLEWDQDEIVCAIYGATTPAEAKARLRTVISGFAVEAYDVNNWAIQGLVSWIADFVSAILDVTPLQGMLETVDYIEALPDTSCALCTGVVPPTYDGTGLLTDLVAYWQLDDLVEDWRPDVHGDYDLQEIGLTYDLETGIFNSGAKFIRGLDSPYKADRAGHSKLTIPGSTTFSISAWVKPLYATAEQWALSTSWNNQWALGGIKLAFLPDFTMRWCVARNSANWQEIIYPEDYVGDVWYHVTCGYVQQTLSFMWLQVNGGTRLNLDIVVPNSSVYHSTGTTNPLYIGGSGYIFNSLWQFNGVVDEVAVWIDRMLEPEESEQLYNNGAGVPYGSFA